MTDEDRSGSTTMDEMVADRERVLIRQRKEWGEILVGWEARNRFEIDDETGGTIGYAVEQGDGLLSMMSRNFLGAMRKATVRITDRKGREVLRGEKPFRFYFQRIDVYDGVGKKLGAVQKRFSVFHRRLSVEDAEGREILRIRSPFFRIWTFKLMDVEEKEQIGMISKRWGGVLKEMFTDADVFGVEFPPAALGLELRKILLVGTFLVDFCYFENNQRD